MKLKELLIEKHITQKELSLRTGITEATISRYVNKERECGLNNAYKIAIALGIEIMDLLEYKPQSYADKMFEELGFEINKKPSCQSYLLFYVRENKIGEDEPYEYIVFHKNKTITTICNDRKYTVVLDMKLLQAINEKVKELGWYE